MGPRVSAGVGAEGVVEFAAVRETLQRFPARDGVLRFRYLGADVTANGDKDYAGFIGRTPRFGVFRAASNGPGEREKAGQDSVAVCVGADQKVGCCRAAAEE